MKISVDIAPPKYSNRSDRGIVCLERSNQTLIVLTDGIASWGNGHQISQWVLDTFFEIYQELSLFSIFRVQHDLTKLSENAPIEIQDEVGWNSFSATAILIDSYHAWILYAGHFQVVLYHGNHKLNQTEPHHMNDTLDLTLDQQRNHPNKGVIHSQNSFMCWMDSNPLREVEPWFLEKGDTLVLMHRLNFLDLDPEVIVELIADHSSSYRLQEKRTGAYKPPVAVVKIT